MRLIDADRLKIGMDADMGGCERNCNKCGWYTILASKEQCGLVDAQPTAYDVNTVIAQLKELSNQYHKRAEKLSKMRTDGWWGMDVGIAQAYERAIEIVKGA